MELPVSPVCLVTCSLARPTMRTSVESPRVRVSHLSNVESLLTGNPQRSLASPPAAKTALSLTSRTSRTPWRVPSGAWMTLPALLLLTGSTPTAVSLHKQYLVVQDLTYLHRRGANSHCVLPCVERPLLHRRRAGVPRRHRRSYSRSCK